MPKFIIVRDLGDAFLLVGKVHITGDAIYTSMAAAVSAAAGVVASDDEPVLIAKVVKRVLVDKRVREEDVE